MNELRYLRAIHGSIGANTRKDATINGAKAQLERELQSSVNYISDGTRNGVKQRFVITPTKVRYKCNIEAFPDEELFAGDVITCCDETWIVTETTVSNPIQVVGTMWLCNHKFRFQNNSPEIIERWGVLDSGVFSTTKKGNDELQYKDVQYKIYLPLDEDTSKIYIDKRLATSTIIYNSHGEKILDVYNVTRVDPISQNYGKGSRLLVLNVRNAANYNSETDNLEEYICDYISAEEPNKPSTEKIKYEIVGRTKIPINSTRKYVAKTNNADDICSWEVTANDLIKYNIDKNTLTIIVPDNEHLIGQKIIVKTAETDTYSESCMEIEVTA